jgi:polar amino acid transport system ATP-binding protein
MNLEIEDLHKSYDGTPVLSGTALACKDFRCLVLVGPSGGGKTTLLRILAGLEIPERGSVRINDQPLDFDEAALRRHRREVGTVFQAFNLFPHLTALANITLPLNVVHGDSPEQADARAMELLSRFQLADHAAKKPAQLSGGQRQRVALVRAIAVKPKFLLFDEPTSALDPEMTAEVLDMIQDLRAEGRDLILVTHQLAFAQSVADQAAFVAEGKILESGPTEHVFSQGKTEICRSFMRRVLRFD